MADTVTAHLLAWRQTFRFRGAKCWTPHDRISVCPPECEASLGFAFTIELWVNGESGCRQPSRPFLCTGTQQVKDFRHIQ